MGGGTEPVCKFARRSSGLSPRGRGNPSPLLLGGGCAGPIPAWAGEPRTRPKEATTTGAYPRVGGGTPSPSPAVSGSAGLSPRGRGNLRPRVDGLRRDGPIPAWAGEPELLRGRGPLRGAYPRVGGGTCVMAIFEGCREGLSPRGRGNLEIEYEVDDGYGPIPAWAGEPAANQQLWTVTTAYPRVGGGTGLDVLSNSPTVGLSPRGRGNRCLWIVIGQALGPIPAWAGEPLHNRASDERGRAYPRVGGGTDALIGWDEWSRGLSPRGRGNLTGGRAPVIDLGPIPAWAGEPGHRAADLGNRRAYPRVGGGTSVWPPTWGACRGLSPRGRGNPQLAELTPGESGPIPAWAGEPGRTWPPWCWWRAYPRVGGGTPRLPVRDAVFPGLSPRGRGNPVAVHVLEW